MTNVTFMPFFERTESEVCDENTLRALGYPLKNASSYVSDQESEILERQMLFRDLLQTEELSLLFSGLVPKLEDMKRILTLVGSVADKETETLFYMLRELTIFTDCIDELHSKWEKLSQRPIASKRILGFFAAVEQIESDENYKHLKTWLAGLDDNVRNLSSVTLGVNLDASLNVQEIGLVSLNSKPYVGSTLFQKIMRGKKPGDQFACITSIGIKESGGLTEKSSIVINRELYAAVNTAVKGVVRKIHKNISDEIRDAAASLVGLCDDIVFLNKCVNYIKSAQTAGLPVTFPKANAQCDVRSLYNPLLLDVMSKKSIVPSDAHFDKDQRVCLLTGPNSGGKTVYICAVGIAQIMFQSGLPVFADTAQMKIYNAVTVHFVETVLKKVEGRLAGEVSRLRDSLLKLHGKALFLLDETFSGTNAYDALYLAEVLVKHLASIECDAIYITHIHELSARIMHGKQSGDYEGIQLLSAKIDDGKREYQIIPYKEEEISSSFARDIIIESGLGFLLKQ